MTELVRFSNSEVQAFKRCKRKWWLAYYRNLTPASREIVGVRSTGTRVHKALEGYYVPDGQVPVSPMVALLEAQATDLAALEAQYGGLELIPEFVTADFDKAIALEKAMVSGYLDWLAESGEDSGLRIVASEIGLALKFEVPGLPEAVFLIGKLDVRAEFVSNGARVFLDHKTVAEFGRLENRLAQDEQCLHYMLLETLLLREEGKEDQPVTGALYNMLRKVKRTGNAKPPFYKRTLVSHSTIELDSYRRRLQATIRDIVRTRALLDAGYEHLDVVYPSPGDTCPWDCDFRSICPSFDDGSRVEDQISSQFKVHDPLGYYEDKDEN